MKYRIRVSDNNHQHFVEEDINYILSEAGTASSDFKIVGVYYSKNKARKAMYRLING